MKRQRNAIATLELVLSLPIILTLVVALVWLGFSVIGQAEVTVEARHAAWQRRFEPWTQTPLAFSEHQEVSEDATMSVDVSPLFDDFTDPESSHTVEQANFDHRSVDVEPLPNWQLYVDVASAAKREGILSQYEDAKAKFENLEAFGSNALSQTLQEIAAGLVNPGDLFGGEANAREDRLELDRDLEEEKRKGRIRNLDAEIRRTESAIEELEASEEPEDEDRLWLLEQKLIRLKIERDIV